MKRILIMLSLCLAFASGIPADSIVQYEDLGRYFRGFKGCFILYDESNDQYTIYNETLCSTGVSPCSTFKIIHALIGLQEHVLQDENTVFSWDGTFYPVSSWNKDQSLQSAIRNSVVWYFEEVYRQLGMEKEQFYINKINYGNMDLSDKNQLFWLQSSLKISPREQIEILRKFYHCQLPFNKEYIDTVKRIIVLQKSDDVTLSGKTGSGAQDGKSVNGWFIGYIERDNAVFYFAVNIQGENGATGNTTKRIALEILKSKSLIE